MQALDAGTITQAVAYQLAQLPVVEQEEITAAVTAKELELEALS